ncbi:MAG: helix-turn-helix transcriptional regulator [Bacteroidales bacterium]|nr:helix-turn-helix transcriptional regulator [Bacteroidales bacterium]
MVVGLAVWQPFAAVGLLLLLVVIALILRRRMNGPVRIVERVPVIGGIQPSQPIVEARDQQFIDNVTRLVEENIDDVQFDIDRMATSMNVSLSVLYSKFKTLLNTTPGNFITEIRLKRAIQLLNTRQYQVQEVARMCGWDSRRYFARSFRQKMGMSPSQYLEQHERDAEREKPE